MSGHSVHSFFFNDTATTEIYTLSLHDALPISDLGRRALGKRLRRGLPRDRGPERLRRGGSHARRDRRLGTDRKSTRLNSSHGYISYAVFCLKKKIAISDQQNLWMSLAGHARLM